MANPETIAHGCPKDGADLHWDQKLTRYRCWVCGFSQLDKSAAVHDLVAAGLVPPVVAPTASVEADELTGGEIAKLWNLSQGYVFQLLAKYGVPKVVREKGTFYFRRADVDAAWERRRREYNDVVVDTNSTARLPATTAVAVAGKPFTPKVPAARPIAPPVAVPERPRVLTRDGVIPPLRIARLHLALQTIADQTKPGTAPSAEVVHALAEFALASDRLEEVTE